jgi:hypothetical protein
LRSQTIQGAAEFNSGENLDPIPWLSLRNSRRRHRSRAFDLQRSDAKGPV